VSLPFYVSPEQLTKDRSDFARAGVSKGRAVIVLATADGIALVTENPSRSLHKIAEVYDAIAFAGVGNYHEFETLRRAGVRYADLRGYSYDRVDVDARGLAEAYAETLGTVFAMQPKPYEVEIAVAEVGATPAQDRIFSVGFDGSLRETGRLVVIGGKATQLRAELSDRLGWGPPADVDDAGAPAGMAASLPLDVGLAAAVAVLTGGNGADAPGPGRVGTTPALTGDQGPDAGGAGGTETAQRLARIECALLDRAATGRKFRRLTPADIATLIAK
jgi:proteasome alpha subunit